MIQVLINTVQEYRGNAGVKPYLGTVTECLECQKMKWRLLNGDYNTIVCFNNLVP